MREQYGDITKFPAMFGRPEMVMTFNTNDVEKVFRFEGKFPHRRTMETLEHYRQNVRPDIYSEYGSLISAWVQVDLKKMTHTK